MPRIAATLVNGVVAAFLVAAICISTIDRAFAQSRFGQIAHDGLTNRYEPPQSETEVQLRRGYVSGADAPLLPVHLEMSDSLRDGWQ